MAATRRRGKAAGGRKSLPVAPENARKTARRKRKSAEKSGNQGALAENIRKKLESCKYREYIERQYVRWPNLADPPGLDDYLYVSISIYHPQASKDLGDRMTEIAGSKVERAYTVSGIPVYRVHRDDMHLFPREGEHDDPDDWTGYYVPFTYEDRVTGEIRKTIRFFEINFNQYLKPEGWKRIKASGTTGRRRRHVKKA